MTLAPDDIEGAGILLAMLFVPSESGRRGDGASPRPGLPVWFLAVLVGALSAGFAVGFALFYRVVP